MTEKALLKAKIDLFNIISNHALESYKHMNFDKNGKRKSVKHIPYSLNGDAEKAREMYFMVYNAEAESVTLEQEEELKAYLLSYRLHRTEYLTEGYKGGNWYYSEQKLKLGMEV
jgi:hypothetical protein